MELIGSLFLILAVGLAAGLFVMQPFIRRQFLGVRAGEGEDQKLDHQRSALPAEHDRVLVALHDLDFDSALGKVPKEDFQAQRASLLMAGGEALRRLEALDRDGQSSDQDGLSMEDRIEAAVAARRADTELSREYQVMNHVEAPAVAVNGLKEVKARDELEDMIASRKRQRKGSAAGFCPRCGRPVQKSDKFCSHCGSTI